MSFKGIWCTSYQLWNNYSRCHQKIFCASRNVINNFNEVNLVSRRSKYALRNKMHLISGLVLPIVLCDEKLKPDWKSFQNKENLTHEYLIKQASGVAVTAATQLLTQTIVAIVDVSESYQQALQDAMSLLEESRIYQTEGALLEHVEDMLIVTRDKVETLKKQLAELHSLMEYVEKVAVAAAETSFLAGADLVSSTLSEMLYSSKLQVAQVKNTISELETEYLLLQKDGISSTGKDK